MSGEPFKDTFYDNHIWPQQYVWPSRRAICSAFETTIANGWRRNNLLSKYDFATEGEGLSEAGKIRVQRILTYAPPQRRTIFVQNGIDAAQTAERVEAVQTFASNLNMNVGPVDVRETYMQDDGRPAQTVDAMFTGFSSNQPAPVLPQSNSTGSGSTGAGS